MADGIHGCFLQPTDTLVEGVGGRGAVPQYVFGVPSPPAPGIKSGWFSTSVFKMPLKQGRHAGPSSGSIAGL